MKIVNWLFLVSVLLFVCGVAFVIAGGRTALTASAGSPVAADVPVTTPVASIKQIMNGIVNPNAYVIYNAIGTKASAAGVEEIEPKNDAEWAAVGNGAAAVIEAGNLMLMGNRAIDKGDWVKMTHAYMDAGKLALKAVEAKDKDGILSAGEALDMSCDSCHAKYQRQ